MGDGAGIRHFRQTNGIRGRDNGKARFLRCGGKELITISSEGVRFIEIRNDQSGAGAHVVFDAGSGTSEVMLVMEPNLHCHWWALRN